MRLLMPNKKIEAPRQKYPKRVYRIVYEPFAVTTDTKRSCDVAVQDMQEALSWVVSLYPRSRIWSITLLGTNEVWV